MKKHITYLLDKIEPISKHLNKDCSKQSEAVALMVVFDILNFILKDDSLGKNRIELVKRIAAVYEIDLKI
jgi:hypothetical protein